MEKKAEQHSDIHTLFLLRISSSPQFHHLKVAPTFVKHYFNLNIISVDSVVDVADDGIAAVGVHNSGQLPRLARWPKMFRSL